MLPKKLLIFPAGTEIAFEIVNALKYSKFVKIYGGTSTDDHAEFVYENLIKGFPFIGEDGFVDYLNRKIDAYGIECIYPAHDSVSLFMSKHREEIHAQLILAEDRTVSVCRSKAKTYEFFSGENFLPRVYVKVGDVEAYPVFIKPAVGQGSEGARKINTKSELEEALRKDPGNVICEYLPGETVRKLR